MRLLSMFLASAVLCSVAMAQSPPGVRSPERRPSDAAPMEQFKSLTETHESGDRSHSLTHTGSLKDQCMAVFAVDPYCSCLQSKLPDSMNFDSFVLILSRSKEENNYNRLDANAKLVYDAIPKVRDFCSVKSRVVP